MIVIKNAFVRRCLGIVISIVLIPLLVIAGALLINEKQYLWVSLGVALLSLALFAVGFDKKAVGTRRLVLCSVMTALSAAGRVVIPFFKPVTALVMITAMYFGREAGFLVGALSALLSNMYFGQGPWTPFQMLAWGLIGYAAGLMSTPLKKSKTVLLIFGALSGVLYSLLVDVWSVLWYNGTFSWSLYAASLLTALPHTVLYAVSNVIFLALAAKPFGDKLGRICIKYGV